MRCLLLLGLLSALCAAEQVGEMASMEADLGNAAMYRQKMIAALDQAQKSYAQMDPSALPDMEKSDLINTLETVGSLVSMFAGQKLTPLTFAAKSQGLVSILSTVGSLILSFLRSLIEGWLNGGDNAVVRTHYRLKSALNSEVPMSQYDLSRLENALMVTECFAKGAKIDLEQQPADIVDLSSIIQSINPEDAKSALKEIKNSGGIWSKVRSCAGFGCSCLFSCFPGLIDLFTSFECVDCLTWLKWFFYSATVATGLATIATLLLTVGTGIATDLLVYYSSSCPTTDALPNPDDNLSILTAVLSPFAMFGYSLSLVSFVAALLPFLLFLVGSFTLFSSSMQSFIPVIIPILLAAVSLAISLGGTTTKAIFGTDLGSVSGIVKALSHPIAEEILGEFMGTYKPLLTHVRTILSEQLDVPFEKISGDDQGSLVNLVNAFATKFNANPTAKPSLMVMMDYFRGLLPSYSESQNPVEGLRQAINDMVFARKCNLDEAEVTVDSLKSAYGRFQEIAAAKEEVSLLGLSENVSSYYLAALDSHKAKGNDFIFEEYRALQAAGSQDADSQAKLKIITDLAAANGLTL